MKRLIVAVLLMTLVLCAMALSQNEPQKAPAAPKEKMQSPGMMGNMGRMGMMPGMMHGMGGQMGGPMGMLKLTDEQKTKIQDLRLAHQKEMIPLQADIQKLRASLKLELTADKFNESKVKSLQGDIAKLQSDVALKNILHMRAVRDLLTAEQKKQFDSHVLSGGMMGGPMGGRGQMAPGRMAPGRMRQGRAMGMGGGMGMSGPAMGGNEMQNCPCMK